MGSMASEDWRCCWASVGGFRRTRYRRVERTGLAGYFVDTAYNLVRMANLLSCQRTRDVQIV